MRGIYQAALNDKPLTDRLIAAVPAAEHLAPVEMVKAAGPLARRADAAIKRLAR